MKNNSHISIYSRWYASIVVIILAVLGSIASKEQVANPNQEIVLQFSGDTLTKDETAHALKVLKLQLEAVGADNIQVSNQAAGQLKITYFSESDVESIKEMLSDQDILALEKPLESNRFPKELPFSDNQVTYNLDVNEIHSGQDFLFEKSGKVAVEFKSDHERFFNANNYIFSSFITTANIDLQVQVAYRFYKSVALKLDNQSRKIPEVRAGPLA